MSTIDEKETTLHPAESGPVNEFKIQIYGGPVEAAAVLRTLYERRMPAEDYSIVSEGDAYGSMCMTVMYPEGRSPHAEAHQKIDPRILLERQRTVSAVKDAKHSARRHFRAVIDPRHSEAEFFRTSIANLAGHTQGKRKDTIKITTDAEVLEALSSFGRSTRGLVKEARVNPPFISVKTDEPTPHENLADTTKSPEFAPEAVRHFLKVTCMPNFGHDAQIIERLEYLGLRVSSVGSRMFETDADGEIQELVMMMHGGSNETLQKAIADIAILIGVKHVDRIEERDTKRYIQLVVPMERNRVIPELQAHHHELHERGRTHHAQFVLTGTLSPHEAAGLRGNLIKAGIGNRPNAAMQPTNGVPMRSSELRGFEENDDFWETMRMLNRRDLELLILKRSKDL